MKFWILVLRLSCGDSDFVMFIGWLDQTILLRVWGLQFSTIREKIAPAEGLKQGLDVDWALGLQALCGALTWSVAQGAPVEPKTNTRQPMNQQSIHYSRPQKCVCGAKNKTMAMFKCAFCWERAGGYAKYSLNPKP